VVNQFNFQILAQLLQDTVVARRELKVAQGACGENYWQEFNVPANTIGLDALHIDLAALTEPKVIVVLGGPGISVTPAGFAAAIQADPIAVLSSTTGMANISPLTIENSGTLIQKVTVIAVE